MGWIITNFYILSSTRADSLRREFLVLVPVINGDDDGLSAQWDGGTRSSEWLTSLEVRIPTESDEKKI